MLNWEKDYRPDKRPNRLKRLMPRTFIAFPLTLPNRERLARVRTDLDAEGADIKWVAPENMHLTLRFLGDVDEETAGKITAGLPQAFSNIESVDVTISGLGAFPSPARPKVIWAGVTDSGNQLADIHGRLQEFLAGLSFPVEERPFAAHITLGRVRRLGKRHTLGNTLPAYTFEPPLRQSLQRIVFYQSTLTPSGPIYSVLGEVALMDSSTPRK